MASSRPVSLVPSFRPFFILYMMSTKTAWQPTRTKTLSRTRTTCRGKSKLSAARALMPEEASASEKTAARRDTGRGATFSQRVGKYALHLPASEGFQLRLL
ncbi:hypothetical protein NDU88_003889 [Pleurodeles waltl]|uniref:Uncharacterized protein n=1 Tax=Pleurodeles waltl TaxID=8319 RepID=A0AAV7PAV5_PLEWA|nr:hypothetical protein NDU88_003889 [Pleurodeles waltl]